MADVDKKKLASKAINTIYGVKTTGKHVENWYAKPLGNDVYRIFRHDGSNIDLKVGDEVGKLGPLSIDELGHARVGNFSVLVGDNIHKHILAKKIKGKDNYLFSIQNPKTGYKKKVKCSKGDTIPGLGVIGDIDDRGQIMVGNGTVPLESKIQELKLLVFNEPHEKVKGALKATFNNIRPGKGSNMQDGIAGAFFPSDPSKNKPASFCEVDPEYGSLQTAVFWVTKDKTFTNASLRSASEARYERALFRKKIAIEKEIRDIGIDPEDHQDHAKVVGMLAECKDKWQQRPFNIFIGKSIFGLEDKYAYDAPSMDR